MAAKMTVKCIAIIHQLINCALICESAVKMLICDCRISWSCWSRKRVLTAERNFRWFDCDVIVIFLMVCICDDFLPRAEHVWVQKHKHSNRSYTKLSWSGGDVPSEVLINKSALQAVRTLICTLTGSNGFVSANDAAVPRSSWHKIITIDLRCIIRIWWILPRFSSAFYLVIKYL